MQTNTPIPSRVGEPLRRLWVLLQLGVAAAFLAVTHHAQAQSGTVMKLYARNAGLQTAPEFGRSASMNDSWVVIGEPGNDDGQDNSGAVHVYNGATGAYYRKLSNPTPGAEARFGHAVALSGDLVLIGAPGGGSAGMCYLMNVRTGALVKAVSPPALGSIHFGWSVALCGRKAAIGDKDAEPSSIPKGAVHCYQDITGAAAPLTITPADAGLGDEWGASVALDGDLLLAGAPHHNAGDGAAYLFDATSGTELKKYPGATAERAGQSVALDAGVVVIGAPGGNGGYGADSGLVYQYQLGAVGAGNATWYGKSAGAMKGASVAIWGTEVVSGDPGFSAFPIMGNGRVQLFNTQSGALVRDFEAADRGNGDALGTAVCAYRNRVLVTAPGDDDRGTDQGAAYLLQNVPIPMTLNLLAATGSHAPGLPEASYTTVSATSASFGSSCVAASGRLIFHTGVAGPGVPGKRGTAIFTTDAQTLIPSLALATGEDLADLGMPGVRAASFSQCNSRHAQRLLFQAKLTGQGVNGGNNALLLADDGTAVFPVIRRGAALPLLGGAVLNSWTNVYQDNSSGPLLLGSLRPGGGVTSANDSVLVQLDLNGAPISALREGDMLAAAGVPLGQILYADVADGGTAIVCAMLKAPSATNVALLATYTGTMSSPVLLARKGSPVPDVPGAVFGSFIAASSLNSSGFKMVRATITGPGVNAGNNEGLWLYVTGNNSLVARKGAQAPGLPAGVLWSRFLGCWPDSTGACLILAQVRGPGVTSANDTILWARMEDGSAMLLMREGDVVDGQGGLKLAAILHVEANSGRYLVQASLAGAPASSNDVLFHGNLGVALSELPLRRPFLRLREGTLYDRMQGSISALTNFSMTYSSLVEPMRIQSLGCASQGSRATMQLRYANGVREMVSGLP